MVERVLLAQAGVRSFSCSGSGVFKDSTAETNLKSAFGAASFTNFQIIVPDFGTFTGPFMVASLEYAGEYNGSNLHNIFGKRRINYLCYCLRSKE